MLLALLTACVDDSDGTLKRARTPNPQTEDGATALDPDTADTGAPGDTQPEDSVPVDTAPQDTDTDVPATTEVCWLGPARDHGVCAPTFADDGSFGSAYDYPEPYSGSAQYAKPVRYIDLDALDPDLEIAPNFTLQEIAESYKGRWGIVQSHMVDSLQDIRDEIGGPLTVTSGYRNPDYNASVGGVTYSRHQYGDGADLDASGWSVEDLGDVCYDQGADYVGLYEDGHTHCDWRDHALDAAFFDTTSGPPAPPAEAATLRCDRSGCEAPATGFDEGEPFRRWWALDADGQILETATGRRYTPPEDAARVRVEVGGRLRLDLRP
jgi:Peptidase M15